MKNLLLILFASVFAFFYGCSNDSGGSSTTDPFGGGGTNNPGGGGGLTIQVQGQADGQGNYIFYIKPSAAITVASVHVSVPAQQFQEDITVNAQFQAGNFQGCLQYPGNVIQTGMQFVFTFTGTSGNQNFTVTSNYTIP